MPAVKNKKLYPDRDAKIIVLRRHGLLPTEIVDLIGEPLGLNLKNISRICAEAGIKFSEADLARLAALKSMQQRRKAANERADDYAKDQEIFDLVHKKGRTRLWICNHRGMTMQQVKNSLSRHGARIRREKAAQALISKGLGQ